MSSRVNKRLATEQSVNNVADRLGQIVRAINGKESGVIYGFHINGNESSPMNNVTYLKDAVGMTPAKMDYTSGTFDYGSWKDAFFMPRPCMVRFDGTTDYYLKENDFTKKEDGTDSDVSNIDYEGNAMIEWGGNGKIYYKIVPDDNDKNSASVYIADYKADKDFECWSFINNQGDLVDRFYTPIYNGTIDDNGRLRSISGLDYTRYCKNKNAQQEIDLAKANNQTNDVLWFTEVYCDITLINLLLILIGKSTQTQTTFGMGRCGYSSSESNMGTTGLMNNKGMFYGSNSQTGIGVKVFGMENYWGNQWRRYAGHISISGNQVIKMTYGTEDGSTVKGYNTTGSGYIGVGATPAGTNGGYINKVEYNQYACMPKEASGSNSTYYSDGLWFNNGATTYAFRGGNCVVGLLVGAFCCSLADPPSYTYWAVGSALSCKPLAR